MLSIQIKDESKKGINYKIYYQFKWLGRQSYDTEPECIVATDADFISDEEIETPYRFLS